MHPITFVKAHPVGTVVTFAAGMMIGPWLLNMLGGKTGININLPQYGGGGE
jgi:predicted membrane protein